MSRTRLPEESGSDDYDVQGTRQGSIATYRPRLTRDTWVSVHEVVLSFDGHVAMWDRWVDGCPRTKSHTERKSRVCTKTFRKEGEELVVFEIREQYTLSVLQ